MLSKELAGGSTALPILDRVQTCAQKVENCLTPSSVYHTLPRTPKAKNTFFIPTFFFLKNGYPYIIVVL